MNAWSNIEVPPDDPDIIEIDKLEETLGEISPKVRQIRELITRFEVCHFKYRQHIKNITESILNLEPNVDPKEIGGHHIKNGQKAWKKDKTGRSLLGQKYLSALTHWLGDHVAVSKVDDDHKELDENVTKWLGEKSPDKEELVRLLLARLTWDWESYEARQHGGKYKDLEFQVCRMDICHYAFPEHINRLLQGIGKMKPVEAFEGCGSFNTEIKALIEEQFSILNDLLGSFTEAGETNINVLTKRWLLACFTKTLKEHVGLKLTLNRDSEKTRP